MQYKINSPSVAGRPYQIKLPHSLYARASLKLSQSPAYPALVRSQLEARGFGHNRTRVWEGERKPSMEALFYGRAMRKMIGGR